MKFRICPQCGANNDHGEICECQKVTLSATDYGTPLFETRTRAVLYRRGLPPSGTNLACVGTLQVYADNEDGWDIGIWAEGVHIRVPLAAVSAIVAEADKTLKGFGGKPQTRKEVTECYT